jgi:hypothetical protein
MDSQFPSIPVVPPLPSVEERPFTLHQVLDPDHQNVVGYVFEHPASWQARSAITWNMANMSVPVETCAFTWDPLSATRVNFLPAPTFFWLEPNYGFHNLGQKVMGQICMPPKPAGETIAQWIAQPLRGQNPGLRVVRTAPAQIAQRIGLILPAGTPFEEVCVTVEYQENGVLMEEEFYGIRFQNQVADYGPQGVIMQINWGIVRPFSFRAVKGQLEAQRPLLWRIAESVKVNPQWEKLLADIIQQLAFQFNQYLQAGYSQIQAAGQLSRAISANNDAMLANFAQQRQAAQVSYAAHHGGPGRTPNDNFSDMIRGVETMDDPYWGTSQQDANYRYHWTDGFGSYQHSDDPFFNPSIGSTQNWTLMQPQS